MLHRCPWGCARDRFDDGSKHAAHAVKCGACQALIPSPQAEMFARLEKVTVKEWLKRVYSQPQK